MAEKKRVAEVISSDEDYHTTFILGSINADLPTPFERKE
jgi:hypothetical protein